MRSIWSGSLSFGLINIPVSIYSGSEERSLNFDMLHKGDLSPIRFARICKEEEKEVPYAEIVKGYEYEKGQYIVVDEKDFKAAQSEKSDIIEIVSFANEDEIDPIYYEKPYYLEPGKGASKAYALLRAALEKSGKVGIVKYIFRNKEHIGIVKPFGLALVMNQMRFQHEIRDARELKLPPEGDVAKKEIDMALKLVDQLTEKFNPKAYKDTYNDKLLKVIDEKLKGHKPKKKSAPAAKGSSKVHDIMSLLKASLDEEKKPKKGRKIA